VCRLLLLLLLFLQAAVFSALGLAAGLLLETTLLIIRTNMPVPLDKKYAHLLDKRWDKQQLHGRQGAAGNSSSNSSRASSKAQRRGHDGGHVRHVKRD
jgi:hypothetical protein